MYAIFSKNQLIIVNKIQITLSKSALWKIQKRPKILERNMYYICALLLPCVIYGQR